MKKRNAITLILAILSSYLFHNEGLGINILIFTIISSFALVYMNKEQEIKHLIIAIVPPILCSIFITIYPQPLTQFIWFLSYLIMWSSMAKRSYPLTIVAQGIVSIFESPLDFLKKERLAIYLENANKKQGIIYAITTLIVFVFLMLYVKSNPVFTDLFSKIDLSFIEYGYISVVFGSYLLLYGLVLIKRNKNIQSLNSINQVISQSQLSKRDDQEFRIAKLSIWIVALILLIANITDLIILFTGRLPVGMSYSEYVHQGFNTLIFTLSLAIGLIIYFYRGQINFHNKIRLLKTVSIFWILQNLLLALLTGYKNFLYVEVYGLTYKRIAVFLGLLCIIIALILSLNKIKKPYSNWFYFNRLGLYAFISLIFISFIPFDKVITRYNLTNSQTIDIEYILSLDKPNLIFVDDFIRENHEIYLKHNQTVQNKIYQLSEQAKTANWQSWNLYLKKYKKTW